MKTAVRAKPIIAYTEVKEEKIVREIVKSLLQKPSEASKKKNIECMNLLRKARRG